MRRALIGAAAALLLLPAAASARAKWDTRVLAHVPAPGYPAHAYVDPDGRIWEGTYVNMFGDALQSRVYEFGEDGSIRTNFVIPGQDLSAEHGVQVATSDAKGRLVLLDRTPARVLILDPATARITEYARAPKGAFLDYAAWLPDGSLLITDYTHATIWKVPPGGGTPTVWLHDPRLDGGAFGTAGIWLLPDHRTLLISQACTGGGGPFTPGALYRLAINDDGSAGTMTTLWSSGLGDLPDGFAVAKSGNVYLANVGLTAQLAEIAPDGRELERFPTMPLTGDNGSPVPFDSPSGVAFRGTSIIVANQSAIVGDPKNQALLDVETGEEGQPEFIPPNAGPAEAVGRSEFVPVEGRVVSRRGRRVTLRLSRSLPTARVRLTAHGRTLASGTVRGRTLRLVLRRGATLPHRSTVRGRQAVALLVG